MQRFRGFRWLAYAPRRRADVSWTPAHEQGRCGSIAIAVDMGVFGSSESGSSAHQKNSGGCFRYRVRPLFHDLVGPHQVKLTSVAARQLLQRIHVRQMGLREVRPFFHSAVVVLCSVRSPGLNPGDPLGPRIGGIVRRPQMVFIAASMTTPLVEYFPPTRRGLAATSATMVVLPPLLGRALLEQTLSAGVGWCRSHKPRQAVHRSSFRSLVAGLGDPCS